VQVAAKDARAAASSATHAPIATLAAPATPAPPSPAASPTMAPTHIIVGTGGLPVNVRTGPSTAAPVITTLREGTLVEALGEPFSIEGRSWQEIGSESRQGWVVAVVVRRRS
jgi:Bacterial SH3 domain